MSKHYFSCNTLKNGMVICYDYRLNECYSNGDDLVLVYKGREMVVPHNELKKRALKIDTRLQPSKYRPYSNYHFKWKPTDGEEIKNKQQTLL